MPAQKRRRSGRCGWFFCRYCWKIKIAFFRFFSYTLNIAAAAYIYASAICFCKAGFLGLRYSLVSYPLCYALLQFYLKSITSCSGQNFQKNRKIMVKPFSAKR
ncbi:hypothetical protein ADH70_010055 [Blautia pseudococcoides]|uniref:Uncharacterized protein n=1 Tax=Blautia pseudococcoides TaxID=1796616 RepID=A0A1C7IBQ8_9FIRM|nr:hypothetical protein A4V09_11590 [Blautia pseudococcoides]ASU29162.1 hypothetical protein ADH70_010055 [Blautia pseudococcoides]